LLKAKLSKRKEKKRKGRESEKEIKAGKKRKTNFI